MRLHVAFGITSSRLARVFVRSVHAGTRNVFGVGGAVCRLGRVPLSLAACRSHGAHRLAATLGPGLGLPAFPPA